MGLKVDTHRLVSKTVERELSEAQAATTHHGWENHEPV
jgi:hypothetical protein